MSNELDIFELTDRARCAQRKLATSTSAQRNALLRAISAALIAEAEEILESNARDCERALDKGMAAGLVDRLRLNDSRVRSIAQSVLDVVGLEDPVGYSRSDGRRWHDLRGASQRDRRCFHLGPQVGQRRDPSRWKRCAFDKRDPRQDHSSGN